LTETSRDSRSAGNRARRYGKLASGAFGTMLDTGLVVVGTLLVGLALATLLGGFGIVGDTDLSTGAFLGSSFVLAIVGLFALGVAAEGPLGRGRRLVGFNIWELGIGRAISGFLVGLGLLVVHSFVERLITDLPPIMQRGADGVYAAAVAGMVAVPLIGVPISLLLRSLPEEYERARRFDVLAIFLVWMIATMIGM
jgi:hypothetical protein